MPAYISTRGTGEAASDASVQYRNLVIGHGAGRFEAFYAEEILAPEVLRGWSGTSNSGWRPAVFGPGDRSRHEFDEDIVTVDGKWQGSAHAKLHVAGRSEPIALKASSGRATGASRSPRRSRRAARRPGRGAAAAPR